MSQVSLASQTYKPSSQKLQAPTTDAKPTVSNSKNAGKADGMFSRSPYQPLTAESPQNVATQRMELNAAVGSLVQKMTSANTNYREFQYNGHKAVLMRQLGAQNFHLSFRNAHASSSLLNRIFHPEKPFQFEINPYTNDVRQTMGRQLGQSELAGALQAVNLNL